MFLCVPRSVKTRLFRVGFLVKWSHRDVCGDTEMSSELSSIIILLVLEDMWAAIACGHRVRAGSRILEGSAPDRRLLWTLMQGVTAGICGP